MSIDKFLPSIERMLAFEGYIELPPNAPKGTNVLLLRDGGMQLCRTRAVPKRQKDGSYLVALAGMLTAYPITQCFVAAL